MPSISRICLCAGMRFATSPLLGLTLLEHLDLRVNPFSQASCEIYIPQIIANNADMDFDRDVCVWRSVTITSGVGGTVTAPGEGTFTCQNGELVRLEAKADSGYTFVKWSGSYSTTENPAILIVKPGSPNPSGVRHPRDLILAGDDDSTPLPDRPNFHCQTAGDSVSYMMCGMPMRGSDCGTGHYHPGGRRSMQLRGTTRTHVMGDSGDVLHIRSEACDQRR